MTTVSSATSFRSGMKRFLILYWRRLSLWLSLPLQQNQVLYPNRVWFKQSIHLTLESNRTSSKSSKRASTTLHSESRIAYHRCRFLTAVPQHRARRKVHHAGKNILREVALEDLLVLDHVNKGPSPAFSVLPLNQHVREALRNGALDALFRDVHALPVGGLPHVVTLCLTHTSHLYLQHRLAEVDRRVQRHLVGHHHTLHYAVLAAVWQVDFLEEHHALALRLTLPQRAYERSRHGGERLFESRDLSQYVLVALRLRPHVLDGTDLHVKGVQAHLRAHGQIGVVPQGSTGNTGMTSKHEIVLRHHVGIVTVVAVRYGLLPLLVRLDCFLHFDFLLLRLRHVFVLSLVLTNVDVVLLIEAARAAAQLCIMRRMNPNGTIRVTVFHDRIHHHLVNRLLGVVVDGSLHVGNGEVFRLPFDAFPSPGTEVLIHLGHVLFRDSFHKSAPSSGAKEADCRSRPKD